MSLDPINGADLTDEERDYLRAGAGLMAAIAEARDIVPGLTNENIAAVLGWGPDRARRVARQLARTGIMAKRSHTLEQVRKATMEPAA